MKKSVVFSLVTGALAGALGAYFLLAMGPRLPLTSETSLVATPAGAVEKDLLESERNTIEVFERVSPGVVFITTSVLRRDWFSLDVLAIPRGSGSGFVWDRKGHVVTNYHVVEGGNALQVVLGDGSSYDAKVVGVEPSKDIAVLWIDAPRDQLHPVRPGRSADLRVGQKVLAIGNPFGLDHSLTTGVVSALGREIEAANNRTIQGVIQTDAAINPGNSGGPLLDSRGRLIGINTAIYSPSGASAGIGFAVPVDTVKRVVPQLIEYGRVIRPALGIRVLSDRVARRLGIDGVIVASVVPGGPADRAGIRGVQRTYRGRRTIGDVIVAVGGRRVTSIDDLMSALEELDVGSDTVVEVLRGDERLSVTVHLEAGT